MKRILQGFTALILLGSLTISLAQSPSYPRNVTVCWTHPTHYELEPGETVAAEIQDGDLAHTRIVGNRHSGEIVLDENVPMQGLPGSQQCQTFVGAIPNSGTYNFVGYSVTIEDISSDASNSAEKKYTGKPQVATGVVAQ